MAGNAGSVCVEGESRVTTFLTIAERAKNSTYIRFF